MFLAFVFLAACPSGLLGFERAQRGQTDLLLGLRAHHERCSIDQILAYLNVALADQDSSLVDRFRMEALLRNAGLESLI